MGTQRLKYVHRDITQYTLSIYACVRERRRDKELMGMCPMWILGLGGID